MKSLDEIEKEMQFLLLEGAEPRAWAEKNLGGRIMELVHSTFQAGRESMSKDVNEKIRLLLLNYANTPLDQRQNGWEWLLKLRAALTPKEPASLGGFNGTGLKFTTPQEPTKE